MADHLLARGHEVTIVDDLSTGKRENISSRARLYEMDVRTGCTEAFEDFEPDALSHQAAQMDVRRSVREPDFDADVNVLGTIGLLQNCVRYGVEKVAFASTGGAVYGEQKVFPAPEDHPQYPVSPYGVSKLAGERYLHFYSVQYGISTASSMASLRSRCATPTSTDPARTRMGDLSRGLKETLRSFAASS